MSADFNQIKCCQNSNYHKITDIAIAFENLLMINGVSTLSQWKYRPRV